MPPKQQTDNTAMRELKKALRQGGLKNLYVFYGDETFLREYYLGELKKAISTSTPPRARSAPWTGLPRRWTACP